MGRLNTVRVLLKHFPQLGLQLCQTILNPAVPHTPGSANLVKEVKREIFDMLKGMTIRVFLKGHFVKKKMFTPPRNWGVPRKIISRRRG